MAVNLPALWAAGPCSAPDRGALWGDGATYGNRPQSRLHCESRAELRESLYCFRTDLASVVSCLCSGSSCFIRAPRCANSSAFLGSRSFTQALEHGFRECRDFVSGIGSGLRSDSGAHCSRAYLAIRRDFGDSLPRLDMCLWHQQRGIEAIIGGSDPCRSSGRRKTFLQFFGGLRK